MSYIRGNKERCKEVIELLKNKGAKNPLSYTGENPTALYYITKNGNISATSDESCKSIISSLLEELTLPEEWKPKFNVYEYVIYQGVVVKVLCKDNALKSYCIEYSDGTKQYSILEKYLTVWKPKRGETVLVSSRNHANWEEAVFSFKIGDGIYHTVGGNSWTFCIPFNINKLGKPREE